jgi:mono/diheme cytochrome c family protein
MKITSFIVTITFAFLMLSCTNASEGDLIEQVDPEIVITYTEHIKPIFDSNCIACHSNPAINGAGVPLTTFSQVQSSIENTNLIDRINKQSGEGGFMPLGGSRMPQASIDLIIQWQTEGFAE